MSTFRLRFLALLLSLLPLPLRADNYVVYDLISDNGYNFVSLDQSGNVTLEWVGGFPQPILYTFTNGALQGSGATPNIVYTGTDPQSLVIFQQRENLYGFLSGYFVWNDPVMTLQWPLFPRPSKSVDSPEKRVNPRDEFCLSRQRNLEIRFSLIKLMLINQNLAGDIVCLGI